MLKNCLLLVIFTMTLRITSHNFISVYLTICLMQIYTLQVFLTLESYLLESSSHNDVAPSVKHQVEVGP